MDWTELIADSDLDWSGGAELMMIISSSIGQASASL